MSRFASIRSAALAAAVAMAFAGACSAGQTVPHKEKCDGQLDGITPSSMMFSGVGKATHMGRYEISGGHDYTEDGQVLNGYFTSIAADGSTVSGTYEGTFAPIGGSLFQFNVVVQWTAGTGRLEGVTGVADVVATLDMATGAVHYDTDGTWTFP